MSWKADSSASGPDKWKWLGLKAIPWIAGGLAFFILFPAFGGRADASGNREYNLYFAGKDKAGLVAEKRMIQSEDSLTARVSAVVESLAAGPNGGLIRTMVNGLSLRRVFVTRDGTAYVDLVPPTEPPKVVDVNRERLCVWSIVDTICMNFPEIREVKILVNGDEKDTLFGHIDISRPLLLDRRLTSNPR